ncbi:hypothetical protein [Paenibacillus barcinonensis]|uniref:hypothetical protein n=1 Tax=Paenibacillus barcinonensis TaxID=198119 RepID=UPI001ABF7AD7|nr:hypothetical protein [Paenibacillus barcinonensis]
MLIYRNANNLYLRYTLLDKMIKATVEELEAGLRQSYYRKLVESKDYILRLALRFW